MRFDSTTFGTPNGNIMIMIMLTEPCSLSPSLTLSVNRRMVETISTFIKLSVSSIWYYLQVRVDFYCQYLPAKLTSRFLLPISSRPPAQSSDHDAVSMVARYGRVVGSRRAESLDTASRELLNCNKRYIP